MRLELTGRHVDVTPPLRRVVDVKLARLERMLNDTAVSAQVVLTREKRGHRADVTLHARGEKFLHGVGRAASWGTSMTQAVDKIVQQAQRVKGKWQERKRRGGTVAQSPAPEEPKAAAASPARGARVRPRMPRILRSSSQPIKSMTVTEAAREVEALGEGVVIFRDVETAAISVLYRRGSGGLTLVETEP